MEGAAGVKAAEPPSILAISGRLGLLAHNLFKVEVRKLKKQFLPIAKEVYSQGHPAPYTHTHI